MNGNIKTVNRVGIVDLIPARSTVDCIVAQTQVAVVITAPHIDGVAPFTSLELLVFSSTGNCVTKDGSNVALRVNLLAVYRVVVKLLNTCLKLDIAAAIRTTRELQSLHIVEDIGAQATQLTRDQVFYTVVREPCCTSYCAIIIR